MATGIGYGCRVAAISKSQFLGFINPNTIPRIGVQLGKAKNTRLFLVYSSKKANLSASRKQRVNLPILQEDGDYDGRGEDERKLSFGEFVNQPSGMEAVLNVNALQSYHLLGDSTYRCKLPKIQLLSFEAVPVLDLRVTSSTDFCTVELLSCKLEGSEFLENQSESFSAIMTNHMTWEGDDPEQFLEIDVKLNLTLEISTRPFTMLPVSAVEVPGNLVMQTLVDTLVPLMIQQLIKDYDEWVHQQLRVSS